MALDTQYAKEQEAITGEIVELEKAIGDYENGRKSAEQFISLIDKYQNFDIMTNTMLNEFVEKILVHERDRKWSKNTTQEVEIYFNSIGKYIPPTMQTAPLTPEEQEGMRKCEERRSKMHQYYLRYKTSGKQQEYDQRYGERHKAKIEADNAAIHAEDMKKGVFVYADDPPTQGRGKRKH